MEEQEIVKNVIETTPVDFTPDRESEQISTDEFARRIGSVFKQITGDYEGASIVTPVGGGTIYARLWFSDNPDIKTKVKFVNKIADMLPRHGNIIDVMNGMTGSTAKSLAFTDDAKDYLAQIVPRVNPENKAVVITTERVKVINEKKEVHWENDQKIKWENLAYERLSIMKYSSGQKVYLVIPIDISKFLKMNNGSKDEKSGDTLQYSVNPTNTLTNGYGYLIEINRYHVEPIEEKLHKYAENRPDSVEFVRPD